MLFLIEVEYNHIKCPIREVVHNKYGTPNIFHSNMGNNDVIYTHTF